MYFPYYAAESEYLFRRIDRDSTDSLQWLDIKYEIFRVWTLSQGYLYGHISATEINASGR